MEYKSKFWFIDPAHGGVGGPYATQELLKDGIKANVMVNWVIKPETFSVTGEHDDLSTMGTGAAWHTSPAMRQHFVDFCDRFNIDPKPFFPEGETPPPTPAEEDRMN